MMNKFFKIISINLLAISLGGCGMMLNPLLMKQAEVEPNNLPDGKLGQPYYAKLRITGEAVLLLLLRENRCQLDQGWY